MNYKIVPTDNFNKEVKRLAKKYRSIPTDLKSLVEELYSKPDLGVQIKENVYKVRMAIASKGKGKSGGARVITYVYIRDETVFLMSIFDKSDKENLTDTELNSILEQIDSEND